MIKLATTNIVGSAAPTSWSQAQSSALDETKQLLVILQLTRNEDDSLIDLATIGPEILSELLARGREADSLAKLETVVKNIIGGVGDGMRAEAAVGLLSGDNLLIYGHGLVDAYLSRDGRLATLGKHFEQGLGIQGVLQRGDVVVLSTTKFSEVVTMSKFKEIITQDEAPAEMLAPLVHTQNETSGVAAIVGVVQDETLPRQWPKINLQLRTGEPRKINLWIGGGILLLLILMIGAGMVRRVRVVAEQNFAELNTSVSAKLDEVMRVGELNPEQARTLLAQARGEVEAYLATDTRDEYKDRARKLAVTIEQADEKAFKKNDIGLETIVELNVLADNLLSEQMKSDGKGNLIFLDKSDSRLVSMNLNDRSRQIIQVGSDKAMLDVGVSEAKVYGLYSSGVNEYFWKKDDEKQVIEADEFWKTPLLIELFAGNIYILDKEQGEIWKYPVLTDGFGGRRRWFAVGIAPDLSNAVDMKVVGDVWLLTSTGKLERYSRGAPVTFSMEGFPAKGESKRLSEPTAVWVTDSLVYVLENGAERVSVFGMDGKYQEQYLNSEFKKASDLVIVDDKGYVIIDNVVKEFGL